MAENTRAADYRITVSKKEFSNEPKIKILGVGGGGGNAVNRMVEAKIQGVDFITVNTDAQVLKRSHADMKIQIGRKITNGLGTGGNPELGKKSAEEDVDCIRDVLRGANMVFITAGMGGGTGTGAAPVIAEIAREMCDLVIAVVTKPFQFEGGPRNRVAEEGIRELRHKVDTMIVIPNQNIFKIIDSNTGANEAYVKVDEVLMNSVSAISDIITSTGIINVDFNDVRTVMKDAGEALMGIGEGREDEPDRAKKAVENAIKYPLLDDMSIEHSTGVVVNITGGDIRLSEIQVIMDSLRSRVSSDAKIFFGNVLNAEMKSIRVTVIATGFSRQHPGTFFPGNDDLGTPFSAGSSMDEIFGPQPNAVQRRPRR